MKFGEEIYPCQVSNMSATGATLAFRSVFELPERFTLELGPEGALVRTCSVVWDDGHQIGVLFIKDGS